MRILVISNLYPPVVRGGYELICEDTVNGLRKRHEVMVLTSSLSDGPLPFEPGVVRELELLDPGKRGAARAALASLHAARTTRRLIDSFKPELIFIWNGARIPQAALRVAENAGLPVVYSLAEHWFGRLYASDPFMRYLAPGQRGLRALWGRVMLAANRHPALRLETKRGVPASIIWISQALKRGVDMPPTINPLVERVIYPAPPNPEVWLGLERCPPSDPPTIAFVGRLEEQKGPSVALRALAALRDRHGIHAQLKLAGRATPEKLLLLERLAKQLDIEDRVELLGQLDRANVGSLLAGASAMVVPSTWQEPFGLVLIEAGLARVPVVASRSGGMPEALHEDSHALFFPIGDANACADALARALTDEEETAARVQRAFEHAAQLTVDNYMAQVDEFISAAVMAHARQAHPPSGDRLAHVRRSAGARAPGRPRSTT
jgi:glycosyltransferase involved in cell wall biosynthesis